MKKKITLTRLIITVIILLSVLLFSSFFYPQLNSDGGVMILMLHDFELPRDLYFWGQNRFGSIVPLLGQVFYKGFGLSPLLSESIVHYIILILGYFSFASLLKSKFSKVIFAIIWFLPLIHFHHGLLRNVFGLQYSLIGIGIFLVNSYSKGISSSFKKVITLLLLFIVFVLAVWVSDAAIITTLLIISIVGFYAYQKNKSFKAFIFRVETGYVILSLILGGTIIFSLKNWAKVSYSDRYNSKMLNSFNEIIESLSHVYNSLSEILLFQVSNSFISIYAYCVVVLLVSVPFFKVVSNDIPRDDKKWMYLFLFDGVVLFFIVLISHWAFLNGVGRRYFTGAYICFWIAYLIYTNCILNTRKRIFLQSFVLLTVLIGFLTTINNFTGGFSKKITPKSFVVREFEQLGKIGIIAEYWNSYGTSFVNPNLIKATPHDKSYVRNYNLVDSVFAQPHLYVIKDMWLDSFPDSMNQFGYELIKIGESFGIGNCWVNEYKIVPNKWRYGLKDFAYPEKYLKLDSIRNKNILHVDARCDNCIGEFILFGPYINLPKGHYSVNFLLKIDKAESTKEFLSLDITADYGNHTLVQRSIDPSDFKGSKDYESIELEFESTKNLSNVEFRLYNLGGVGFTFDSLKLRKKEP